MLKNLIGKKVLLLCGNYFYAGILAEVADDCVMLKNAEIVYDTGEWSSKKYALSESLPGERWCVQRSFIESFGLSK